MATKTYDFLTPAEYSTASVSLGAGDAQLVPLALVGTVKANLGFKGVQGNSFSVSETLNGGTVLYALEIDTVLSYHDGAAWVPSNGLPGQLNTQAQLVANFASVLTLDRELVKPYVYLARSLPTDPSPVVDDLVFDFALLAPNSQLLLGNAPEVALNTGVGGAASPGETRVTLDPTQVLWKPGANDLFVFRNGVLQALGQPLGYIEEDSTHIVFQFLVDDTGPFIDELVFRAAVQGSSLFIPAPVTFLQAVPPARPDNFGGLFSFA